MELKNNNKSKRLLKDFNKFYNKITSSKSTYKI